MAKKLKDAPAAAGVAKKDLKSVIADINRLKDSASEASGLAGKRTQQACEQYGLEKTALTFTARLERMEPAKRGGIVRSLHEYFHKAGFYDQIDAFDDVVDTLKSIIADIEGDGGDDKPRERDDTIMDDLVGGAPH